MPSHQYSLSLITHQVQNSIVEQRASDGYINATAMCKAAGKQFNEYTSKTSTTAFLQELAAETGISVSELVQVVKGGQPHLQGSWVHPQVAIHLAQWVSAKFAVQVSKWVFDWMSGKGKPTKLPYHLERHVLNNHKVPPDKFSVLQEMASCMLGPMESNGYTMPENLMPDISQAKLLCKTLREHAGIDTKQLEKYTHTFPDGREVEANLYPTEHLPLFRRLMAEVWLPTMAAPYFKARDPSALPALDKMLMLGQAPAPKALPANKPKFKKKA